MDKIGNCKSRKVDKGIYEGVVFHKELVAHPENGGGYHLWNNWLILAAKYPGL